MFGTQIRATHSPAHLLLLFLRTFLISMADARCAHFCGGCLLIITVFSKHRELAKPCAHGVRIDTYVDTVRTVAAVSNLSNKLIKEAAILIIKLARAAFIYG